MKLFTLGTFRVGVNNLRLHKLRSLLTSLGIIFGVAAVAVGRWPNDPSAPMIDL